MSIHLILILFALASANLLLCFHAGSLERRVAALEALVEAVQTVREP